MTTHTRPPPTRAASDICVGCASALEGGHRCDHCGAAQRAGRFTIERVLHQSARGRLYLARDAAGRAVALKELVFATVPDVATLEAFEREAELLAQLSHPRVPSFLGRFTEGTGVHTRLYLAQAFIEGESLLARLEHHRFSEAEARHIASQVLEVLVYLHGVSPRVLHRDLKPANLLLRADGAVVVVDFGAARELARSHTHGATLVGTFGYMSAEQLGGTVSPQSDLHALGATLVHLLSRTAPAELFGRDLRLEFEDRVSVSPAFAGFLRRLTAADPSHRFASARDALETLRTLGSLPTPATRSPTPVAPSSRPPLAAQAVAATVGVGAVAWFALGGNQVLQEIGPLALGLVTVGTMAATAWWGWFRGR